jgi:hypothetical protein
MSKKQQIDQLKYQALFHSQAFMRDCWIEKDGDGTRFVIRQIDLSPHGEGTAKQFRLTIDELKTIVELSKDFC